MRAAFILIAAVALSTTAVAAENFKGYDCKSTCSGHEAGYAWAKRKGVTSKSQCTGKSQSFVEGCWAWVAGK